MSLTIPTIQEQKDTNLANLESQLGQTAPINDKAFLRVIAAMEALQGAGLYRLGIERAKQNLAITASGNDLDLLGSEYGVNRKAAEAAVLTATLPALTGTLIPATIDFIGNSNGVRYALDASVIAAAGVATLSLTATEMGVIGNLQISDTLSIGTQVAGAETTATVTVIDNIGADEETDDVYRLRVLDAIRGVGGGGNTFDYRSWAQEVAGVTRAYPYSGRPVADLAATAPPDRTVYVEADTTIDADGIAPQSLLDEVRDTITTDPVTGLSRQPLGLTDDTLFIESISRLSFFVTINDLTVSADIEANVKADIETALETYFRSIRPFVEGLDSALERNDLITDLTVSEVVQDILSANGGSASAVSFGLTVDTFTPQYRLQPGELAKSGGVTYV